MMRPAFPLILGIGGIAVLLALGLWQVRRMEWKEALIARIETRLAAPPEALAAAGAPNRDALRYGAVRVSGATTGAEVLVLSGLKGVGAGYRVIQGFDTEDGRRILLDRGFIAETQRREPRPSVPLVAEGNLDWPEEADGFTPKPDLAAGIWFARDVDAMAEALGTEPVMVVVRAASGEAQGILPQPVDTSGIPNDHFGYAVTWFSLALVWAGMTGFLLWRIRRPMI